MNPADILRLGGIGLRTRPLRVVLSALGIAIGIAAMVAVVGISASSRAEVDRRLAALGTNLLTAGPGKSFFGDASHLPEEAEAMVARIGPVTAVSAVGRVPTAHVYRSDRIPAAESGGIAVLAARTTLPGTVGATVHAGTWLAAPTYPTVVLGSRAAGILGLTDGLGLNVWLGGHWFTVVGILDPVPLAPELDSAALIGWPVAADVLGFDGYPTTIYSRSRDDAVPDVAAVLAATANPAAPNEVQVSRPSDALAAKEATDTAYTGLLLGLGAVALLVGGVGVANTMVISVLERRPEIGLRRALGATRAHVRLQFLAESLLLAALGGLSGVLLGALVTATYAAWRDWPAVLPAWSLAGGLGATLVIGAIAGLYPAMRAARMSPTAALNTAA
ncbi:ABC transporter permease [Dactylosporangium sp. CS-033363]|uniref:ABC transporter permease n=1 Tax=Dactylosporangium sp. CS-033363 TaxID=3239935 RepID=UPI003D93BD17